MGRRWEHSIRVMFCLFFCVFISFDSIKTRTPISDASVPYQPVTLLPKGGMTTTVIIRKSGEVNNTYVGKALPPRDTFPWLTRKPGWKSAGALKMSKRVWNWRHVMGHAAHHRHSLIKRWQWLPPLPCDNSDFPLSLLLWSFPPRGFRLSYVTYSRPGAELISLFVFTRSTYLNHVIFISQT